MIAVDTNILIYAHRSESSWHSMAAGCLRKLAENDRAWMIPWPCINEFLAITTNAKVYPIPTPLDVAFEQLRAWMESPGLSLVHETSRHLDTLRTLLERSRVTGGAIHDARIAAICIDHGVTELWTADRDFLRFPGVPVVNPLVGGQSRRTGR